jgi:diguanylate cyclase (GGDEF)-like protein
VAEQQRILTRLARIDELTGLYNRRHIMELLEAELSRSRRYGTHLSLLLMDIDHFKSINDDYGHESGDAALAQIAAAARKTIRGESALGRYGGEEFLAILPLTTSSEACTVAERVRDAVENESVEMGEASIKVTVSIGVASFHPGANQGHHFATLKEADQALYRAKGAGRNRVAAAHG